MLFSSVPGIERRTVNFAVIIGVFMYVTEIDKQLNILSRHLTP